MLTNSSSKNNDTADPFPSELSAPVADFHAGLAKIASEVTGPLVSGVKRTDLLEPLNATEKAKVDLVSAFAINSLVWMWLKTQGQDPKDSEVKGELDRVKACMQRLKEIELKNASHPRIDKSAANRFVESGLWKPGQAKIRSQSSTGRNDEKTEVNSPTPSKKARK